MINTISLFPVEFYQSPQVPDDFLTALFSRAEFISLYHWKFLLVVSVTPFILHCPPLLLEKVLGPSLPALVSHLNDRIQSAWTAESMGRRSETE